MVFVVVVLAISNILVNRVLPAWSYVPWNVAVAALVVMIGVRTLPVGRLGLARWRSGARWGIVVAAVVVAGYLLAAALPATRQVFDDRRVDGGWEFLVYHAVVRIPLGTVLLEELAFRAVLPAFLSSCHVGSPRSGRFDMTESSRRRDMYRGVLVASLLFGLWHVLPAWEVNEANPVVGEAFGNDGLGQAAAVVLAVFGTFVAGLGLCALRYWSGSVLAPILVHVTTNSAAYALAWQLGS